MLYTSGQIQIHLNQRPPKNPLFEFDASDAMYSAIHNIARP